MDKKVARVTITLVDDVFDETGSNVLIAEGLRTSSVIRYGGGSIMPTAEIVIYGLNLPAMQKLVRIRWQTLDSLFNTIQIEAGDFGKPLSLAFAGNITFAYIDTSNAPDIGLRITSVAGIVKAYEPTPPVSYQGQKSVVSAIRELTERMGFIFENNGVPEDLIMSDVTLVDTDLNKVRKLCRDYQVDLYVEQDALATCPQGAPRQFRTIPVLTPQTGLIGYPVPTTQGIDLKCLWNPEIRFGGIIRVQGSIIEYANTDWRIFGISTQLETELPGGNWFMHIQASYRDANNVAISRA